MLSTLNIKIAKCQARSKIQDPESMRSSCREKS